jgi:DnaJ family protein B protein 9
MKRQYKLKALRFHPDKNKSPDASAKFQEIHEAYQTLLQHYSGDTSSHSAAAATYKDMW